MRRRTGADERYNLDVRICCILGTLVLSATVFAQAQATCPADRPVDDIIAEVKKLQSKKNNRNKNPLEGICVFGWCRAVPEKTQPSAPASQPADSQSDGNTSSSKDPTARCNDAMETALDAAHNVEVGDNYFDERKYKPAMLRYKDAAEEKPDDIAIQVRLGRVLEKLNDLPQAIEHYQAAEKLTGPEKWAQEAHAALARLRPAGTVP